MGLGSQRVTGRKASILVAVYLDHQAELKRFCRARLGAAADLDDVIQEIFFKVSAVDPAQEIQNPLAYLYRLASNVILDHLRGERRARLRDTDWRQAHQTSLGGEDVAAAADAEATVISRQRLALVVAALEAVAPPARQAFRLHKFAGLSHAETAARMGISKSAVEKHISLVLKHLAVKLGDRR